MATGARRLRDHVVSALVVVLGVAASAAAFAVAETSVRHENRLLLRQDATQGSLVVGSLLGQPPQPVVDLAATIGPSGVPGPGWRTRAAAVVRASHDSALVVLRRAGGHFALVAGVGTPHRHFGNGANTAARAALRRGRSLAWEVSSGSGRRWLGEFIGSPTVTGGSVIYLERPLATGPLSLAALPGHPFSGLQAAIFAGRDSAGHLVAATTGHIPFAGAQATTVVAAGTAFGVKPVTLSTRPVPTSAEGELVLVVKPDGSLVGASAAAEPWVLLGGGVAATLVFGGLLQLANRRRRAAEALAGELMERNDALDAARAAELRIDARFAAMVRSSSDLTTVTDARGRISYQSPASLRLLGADPGVLVGTAMAALVHPDDRDGWRQALTDVAQTPGAEAVGEWRLRSAADGYVTVESRVTNLLQDPAVAGIVFNSRDVTERRRLESELRHRAFHDPLTGLANRALLAERVRQAVAHLARSDGAVGLLLLDLDNFKAVNDGRGHSVGDELLKVVGNRLRDTARAGETVARLGGDEFALLVEIDEPAGASARARQLLDTVQVPIVVANRPVEVRVSIGVVTTTDPAATAEALLRDADIAMYAAKSAGKARFAVLHPGLRDQLIDRLELENDLSRAIGTGELVIHYQTLVDIDTTIATGVEALLRWQHPRRGLLAPSTFIPIAERSGLIVPLGRWLLQRACDDARLLQRRWERPDLHLAVNVSVHQLDAPAFVDDVADALQRSGLAPQLLTLEVTESVFVADPERCAAVLRRLKAIGVHLSIDDFGTGFSSLGYLQHLPLDELKIDRSFVIAGDADTPPPLVHSIVRMADDLGLTTVAEGVETEQQLRHMRAAGCRSAQGFLFARPAGLDRLLGDASYRRAAPASRST